MFTRDDLSNFRMPWKLRTNYVEIECGCTHRRFGDAFGKLRVYVDGRIEIDCCCNSRCPKVKLSPIQFARHLGKSTTVDSWKNNLWVLSKDGKKIELVNTCLLRYHVQVFQRPLRPSVHRDEFIVCSKCKKLRRFHLRDEKQYRIYHKATLKKKWQCSDSVMNCANLEERRSRRPCRGCPRKSKCKGCKYCVCTGCNMCRLKDCNCQICVDYVKNVWRGGSD